MRVDEPRSHAVENVSAQKNVSAKNVDNKAALPTQSDDAGKNSKVGELQNKGSQIKQNVLADVKSPKAPADFSKEATVTKVGNETVIDAGAGDDKISVSQNVKTGDVTVTVNGAKRTFTGADKDHLVIKAGDGNDTIKVGKGVTVQLRLEGEKGNDTITVDQSVKIGQKIFGGDGSDTILGGGGNDKIEAGAGDDTVDGRGGDDYVNGSKGNDTLKGGVGNDVIYGGDGDDTIEGNDGNDYLEGSKGNDTIAGGKGTDVLSGGIGDDTLKGDAGNDVLYAGQGKDKLFGGQGDNKIFSQTDDTVEANAKGINNRVVTVELKGNPGGTSVKIEGSDEFKERVEADLEMLRSSPTGRQMLEGYDQAYNDTRSKLADLPLIGGMFNQGVTVTIKEHDSDSGSADWENRTSPTKPQPSIDPTTGAKGTPNSAIINYKPSYMPTYTYPDGDVESVPSVVLFHEMAHAYDYTHGTFNGTNYAGTDTGDNGIRNGERVAVGLPIDHDNDPKTAEQKDTANHPDQLTEDALREEMNLKRRNHYAGGKSRV
ncbi:MAG: M91 family zinc metallopeptidase [Pyrinomonadaceae bacterium]